MHALNHEINNITVNFLTFKVNSSKKLTSKEKICMFKMQNITAASSSKPNEGEFRMMFFFCKNVSCGLSLEWSQMTCPELTIAKMVCAQTFMQNIGIYIIFDSFCISLLPMFKRHFKLTIICLNTGPL